MNLIRRVLHQLGRDGRRVHLQPHERAVGRQRLVELMARIPLRPLSAGQDELRFRPMARPGFWVRPALVAGCLVVLVGAGTVTAAERSLPGDLLYGVKIQLTERLQGWAAVTQEAKTRLAVSRAQRRLEEAARLAASRRLDTGVLGAVEVRLQDQADQTRRELEVLGATGNAEAAAQLGSRYEAVLKANTRVLENIETTVRVHGDDGGRASALAPVISQLQAQGAAAAQARGDAEAVVAEAPPEAARVSAGRERQAAQQALASVQAKLDRRRPKLTPEAAEQIQAQLDAAQQALSDGQETYDAGAHGAAFARFGAAERTAIGAGLLLQAREQLRVQVPLGRDVPKVQPKTSGGEPDEPLLVPGADTPKPSPRNVAAPGEDAKQAPKKNRRGDASGGLELQLQGEATLRLGTPGGDEDEGRRPQRSSP